MTAHAVPPSPRGRPPRVIVLAGTRPEAIKMVPVLDALRARGDEIETHLVLTGQHAELVDDVLSRFGVRPDRDLDVMRPGQDLYDIAGRCLTGVRDVVRELGADALLVQGDTASVAFGALVGFMERVWVGHVEAGLRSGDPDRPWPEENFRRLTDVLSRGFFAPTPAAADNLRREQHPEAAIHVTGNTVVDALLRVTAGATDDTPSSHAAWSSPELARIVEGARASGRRIVLVTAHRRESFGAPLEGVFSALRALVEADPSLELVYPVHPNPNVHGPAHARLGGVDRIHLLAPVDHFDLVQLLRVSALALTDSGGIQEEAPTFGTPVLVLRDVTERPEGITAGVAELVGTDPARIVARAHARLAAGRGSGVNPYGDGRAGERIADLVIHHLIGTPRRTRDWNPDEGPA